MLRLLRFLLTGDTHLHKWETLRDVEVVGDVGTWTRYYCKCAVCGAHKRFD